MIVEKVGSIVYLHFPAEGICVCAGYNIYNVCLWVEGRLLPVTTIFDGEFYISEDDITKIDYSANDNGKVLLNITLKAWRV